MDDAINQFVQNWTLDARSQQLMESLPLEVQATVIAGFNPPADTRSRDAKLNAFVRNVQQTQGQTLGVTVPGQQVAWIAGASATDPSTGALVAEFVNKWGLDEVSSKLLLGQDPGYVREVTQSFNPPADTRNVNAIFIKFMRGGAGFRQPGSIVVNGGAGGGNGQGWTPTWKPQFDKSQGFGGKGAFGGDGGGFGKGDGKGKGKGMRGFPPSQRVWIGNVSADITWKELQEHMNAAGKTRWVEVFQNKGKGTGAVAYGSPEEAMNAVAMLNSSMLKGLPIVCDGWEMRP